MTANFQGSQKAYTPCLTIAWARLVVPFDLSFSKWQSRVLKDTRQLFGLSLALNRLSSNACDTTGQSYCAAVDKFQEGCGQTIEASKKYEWAVTELAEARKELADTSVALAQAQRNSKHLKQRLVGPCYKPNAHTQQTPVQMSAPHQ